MSLLEKWISVIKSPKATLAAEKPNSFYSGGLLNIALPAAMMGALFVVFYWYAFEQFYGTSSPFGGISSLFLFALAGAIIFPLFVILFSFIFNGIVYLCARLLGGKGIFKEHFYLQALTQAPFQVLTLVSYVFVLVPFIGFLFVWIVSLGINLIALYYSALAVAEAHQFSVGRAFAAILLPIVLLAALFFLLIIPASVLWYTGVFNPAKFRSGPECGGFAMFTCIDQSVSSSSSVFSLGNAVGRSIEVKSATVRGMNAPTGCTIDDRLGGGSKTISATSRIFIECGPSGAPAGSTYDWTLSIEYVDSQSGLSKTDYGGFVRGKVAGGTNSGLPQNGAILPTASISGNYPQSGYQAASQCGGFGSFTCIDQSATASSTTLVLGNALGRNIEIQSASLIGLGAPINCFAQSSPGSASPLVYANGKVYIECGKSTLSSGSPYDWGVSLSYKDVPSGLSHTDSGGFMLGRIG